MTISTIANAVAGRRAELATATATVAVPNEAAQSVSSAIAATTLAGSQADEKTMSISEKRAPEKPEAELMKQWQLQLQSQRNLEFSVDTDSGRDVVKVLDGESGDVIRQFPSEDVLKLARAAAAGKGGLFVGEA